MTIVGDPINDGIGGVDVDVDVVTTTGDGGYYHPKEDGGGLGVIDIDLYMLAHHHHHRRRRQYSTEDETTSSDDRTTNNNKTSPLSPTPTDGSSSFDLDAIIDITDENDNNEEEEEELPPSTIDITAIIRQKQQQQHPVLGSGRIIKSIHNNEEEKEVLIGTTKTISSVMNNEPSCTSTPITSIEERRENDSKIDHVLESSLLSSNLIDAVLQDDDSPPTMPMRRSSRSLRFDDDDDDDDDDNNSNSNSNFSSPEAEKEEKSSSTPPPANNKSIVPTTTEKTASGTTRKKNKKKKKRKTAVNFTTVHIRQYERILCENPAVSSGPSIGIGWRYVENEPLSVREYEKSRGPLRRLPSEFLLSRPVRDDLVRYLGYTDREIASTLRSLNKAKFKRRQTTNNLPAQKVEEAIEKARRQVSKLLKSLN